MDPCSCLREGSRDPDHCANAIKVAIEQLQAAGPQKFLWLDLFASFRILRNLYANKATEFTGLRFLWWSNLFDCLYQKITSPPEPPIKEEDATPENIFSITHLDRYASVVLQQLITEATDILLASGQLGPEMQKEIEGAYEEIRRDFEYMLDIEAVGHEGMEKMAAEDDAESEELIGAMEWLEVDGELEMTTS